LAVPAVARSLPITSFEERLTANDRPRRPATIPPGAPIPGAPVTADPSSSTSSVVELAPDDILHESGRFERNGKSASNFRRVHVLTDPVHRSGEDGEATVVRAPLTHDIPEATPAIRAPSRGEMIIGGTREELDAASRATTVRLDPVSAAAAVLAATEAAAGMSSSLRAVTPAGADITDAAILDPAAEGRLRTPDPASGASIEVAADSGVHEPATSQIDGPAASHDAGTPAVASMRRRSSAMPSTSQGEPRDWGTIPPLANDGELVPGTPSAPLAPLGRTLPELAGPRKLPLLPILVVIALALLILLYAV